MKLNLLLLLASISFTVCSQTIDDERTVNWHNVGLTNSCNSPTQIINFLDAGGSGDGASPNDAVMNTVLASISSGVTVIYFPPGNYFFQSSISLQSNTIIKGAGAESTTLTFDLNVPSDAIIIKGGESATYSFCTNNISKNAHTLPLEDAGDFDIGDYVELFEQDGMLVTSDWAINTTGQIFKIENIIGNTLYVDAEVRRDFFTSRSVEVKKLNPKINVGIEELTIIRQDETTKNYSNIYFKYAAECWVRGVASYECNYAHIELHTTTHSEVSGCYIQDAFDYGDGGRAYGVVVHYTSGDNLVTDNIFNHLRHSMLLQAGANGNVFSYNYSINPHWSDTWLPSSSAGDLVLHGNYPYANLFEGNTIQNIVIDDSHGGNGKYNTFFRNRAELYGIFMSSSSAGGYQNFVGNEITNSGSLLGLYSLSGSGHFEYGNNKIGTIIPSGTSDLSESTLYIASPDAFYLTESEFPPIGTPQPFNNFLIESEMRYTEDLLTMSDDCNSKIILVESTDNTSYCNGDSINIHFVVAGLFNPENIFRVQLINSADETDVINLIGDVSANEIICNASGIATGNYYLRIVANSPFSIGTISENTIAIGNNSSTAITETIDEGSSYTLPDGSLTSTAGTYVFNYTNTFGCDSIITVTLNINSVCAIPSGMNVLFTTATTAKIYWTADEDAALYHLQYRVEGTTTWHKKYCYSSSKLIIALLPSTTYQYKIRAKCGGEWTDFSAINTFTTLELRKGETLAENSLVVFPNPGDGLFAGNFMNTDESYRIEITNINGTKVFNGIFSGEIFQIDLRGYSSGLYYLQLITDDGSIITQPIIVN
ncbi:MAG: T9SS type A sorting domain-containing protein [Bacteroidetes bacterium]|nr:T9SS type A sorting domain-containing protein [Bacteroidota bacterium]MBK8488732.1 T9SS type A sorting domain-containing protein [Bacteroidota bacterium]